MAQWDMRYGQCGACGGCEVYRGDYAVQASLRQSGKGKIGARQPVFEAYICAACGNTQLHVRLDAKMSSYIRRKLDWVPPQKNIG